MIFHSKGGEKSISFHVIFLGFTFFVEFSNSAKNEWWKAYPPPSLSQLDGPCLDDVRIFGDPKKKHISSFFIYN